MILTLNAPRQIHLSNLRHETLAFGLEISGVGLYDCFGMIRDLPAVLLFCFTSLSGSCHSCCRCHGLGCTFACPSTTTNVCTYCTAQSLTLLLVPMVCRACEAECATRRLQASVHCCLMSQGLLGWLRKLRKTRGEVSSPSVQISRCTDLLKCYFQCRPGYSSWAWTMPAKLPF